MAKTTVQLLTNQAPPQWWISLQSLAELEVSWSIQPELNPKASIVILPRNELTDIRKEELSNSKSYIVADDLWTAQKLKRALAIAKGALFLDTTHDLTEHRRIIQVAMARHAERERHSTIMQMLRSQNKQIHELNTNLEKAVIERTTNVGDSRKASRRNIAKVREIIGFIKEMSQVLDVAELLPVIRQHLKEHHELESPILFIPRGDTFGDFCYIRGSQTIRTSRRAKWEASPRIRINQSADSRFLADALSRPFGLVIRFPLVTARHQREAARSPLLYFEHNLSNADLDDLVASISERLQPVSWALDRLVLEQELKGTSRDWEMTFDGLAEPIAILDLEGTVIRANAHWRKEFHDVMSKSSQMRVGEQLFAIEKYPIRMTEDAPPLSWVVYLRDETRSQKLKSQAVQVEKMSAIGQLAGHIAHELNNPLTGIRSLSQVLLTETAPESQLHLDLQEVEKASERCQGIINNLLDFSKGGLDHSIQTMDLNEITTRTLPFLKSATGRFRSDIQLSADPLLVKVEPHLMQQVIFNLVNNACQAMSEKGEISVHTRRTTDWAVLEIKDTGPGIADDVRSRIFEPFFTTKVEGEGTGLGLSLSRDFVRQFGGDLECESTVGKGSIFRVRLPLESTP